MYSDCFCFENIWDDEKPSKSIVSYEHLLVFFLHGMSSFLGGKIKSDMHQDVCFPKGLSVEATKLTLFNNNGSKIDLIQNAKLRYELLK